MIIVNGSKEPCGKIGKTLLLAAFVAACAIPAQTQAQLPAGSGKAAVERACQSCHDLERVVGFKHAREDWEAVVTLMASMGAPLTKDEVPVVIDYLASNFNGPAKPRPVVIPGNVEISIHEWDTPTKAGAHDPLVAPDGSVWWTGPMGNLVGRFDPKTQQMKEFTLKTPNSTPHGLVADKDNNIWFTGMTGGYVGKLNPKSGEITEYHMPDPPPNVGRRTASGERTLDPHTPVFDQKGFLWFTMQQSSRVGRLDPKTGEIQIAAMPTSGRTDPYGIVINSKGVPYFANWRSNRLGSVDPQTMKITEHVIPFEDARPRRIAVTPDDMVWYGDDARGVLGKFDPKTGQFKEYPSPSGPTSRPYGMTAVGTIVWYVETGVSPNTVVRFDPKTEKFQSWEIPSGGGTVRFMVHDPAGDLWLAESGLNKIAKVEVKEKK